MDFSATDTSKLLKIRRPTIRNEYNYFRKVIFEYSKELERETLSGIIKEDL